MFEVLRSGLYDSIQDLGRWGFESFGVPCSGVMDRSSAILANRLLGNDIHEAVLEMTMLGPKLKFHKAATICVTGAKILMSLNDQKVKTNLPLFIEKGQVLNISQCVQGARAYMAIKGGFDSQRVMGSRSQFQSITDRIRLKKEDIVRWRVNEANASLRMTVRLKPQVVFNHVLDVYKGPEYELFESYLSQLFAGQQLIVSASSNRMAYQFNNQLQEHGESIITSLVVPGTVQYTPSGKLLVLMRDAQTTGGYPRVFQLTENSVDLLSQKKAGETIEFRLLDF